jgi:hypothetical protein
MVLILDTYGIKMVLLDHTASYFNIGGININETRVLQTLTRCFELLQCVERGTIGLLRCARCLPLTECP